MPITKTDSKLNGLTKYRVRVNYTDTEGRHKQIERSVAGLAEAKRVEAELISEYKKEPSARLTVNDLYTEYIKIKQYEIRETSLVKSSGIFRRHILPYLGGIKLSNLSVASLNGWKAEINNKSLSITMRKNIYKELNALLNFAVKADYIAANPLKKVGNFKDAYLTEHINELNYYTVEEFSLFISSAFSDCKSLIDFGCYVFFCIAFFTGARKGEINALRWTDVSDETLRIRKSVTQKLKGSSDVVTAPKNISSIRDIRMPLQLLRVLAEHKERQKQSSAFSESLYICGGIAPLRDTTIENHNIHWAKLSNLKHIRIHDFRHSHASLLANEGINIQEIARRLGHSDIETTLTIYAHLYPREEDRALSILNNITLPPH